MAGCIGWGVGRSVRRDANAYSVGNFIEKLNCLQLFKVFDVKNRIPGIRVDGIIIKAM